MVLLKRAAMGLFKGGGGVKNRVIFFILLEICLGLCSLYNLFEA